MHRYSNVELDDIEAFATKHAIRKTNLKKDVFDPFDKTPYKPKKSFIRKSPNAKQYTSENFTCCGVEYILDEAPQQKTKPKIKSVRGNTSKQPTIDTTEGY